MKNLKYLYAEGKFVDHARVLSLEQLREISSGQYQLCVYDLFQRKQPDGLKIFFFGMCLNDPEEVQRLNGDEAFVCWAENETGRKDTALPPCSLLSEAWPVWKVRYRRWFKKNWECRSLDEGVSLRISRKST